MDNIEQEIQSKGLTAPRVTPAQIEATIAYEYNFTAQEGAIGAIYVHNQHGDMPPVIGTHESLSLLTICVLVLKNGFTVTGESACASPENFDADLGRKIARQHAVEKIWPLEGYLLKAKLAAAG
jgi:Phage protein (N4 Gp49/phage Sf6 gene 66) family